jgi:hypothetical protein
MSTDIQQFGRENSDGAIVSRESLIQLGHFPPYTGEPLHHVDLDAHSSQIQSSLNTSNSAAND